MKLVSNPFCKYLGVAVLTLAGLAASSLAYALPYEISYMGRLTESNGMPISGPINVEVKFFRSLSGGDQVGSTLTFNALPLADGVFQVNLSLTPADFHTVFPNDSSSTYIEVTDLSHNKIYTRQKYSTVPYALKVPVDGTNVSYDAEGKLTVVGLKGAALPAGAPTSGQILKMGASGLEWGSDLTGGAPGSVSTTEIQDGTVGNIDIATMAAIAGTKIAPNFGAQNIVTTGTISGTGALMSGAIDMGTTNKITNLASPTLATDAATKAYADGVVAPYLKKDGSAPLTGSWAVGGFNILGVGSFTAGAATVSSVSTGLQAAVMLNPYGTAAGQTGELQFKELSVVRHNSVGFKAPDSISSNVTWILPSTDGAPNQVLNTNGSGTLSWVSPSAGTVADMIVDAVTNVAPSQNAVFDALALKVDKSGGTMTGVLNMGNQKIVGLATPTLATDAATMSYVDASDAALIKKDGTVPLSGNWSVGGFNIAGVGTFSAGATTLTSLTTTGQAALTLSPYAAGAGQTGELRFRALTGSNYVGFKASDTVVANKIWTLPAADGTASQVLKTDGAGNLAWVTSSSLTVSQSVTSGVTATSPSENAVYNALAATVAKTGSTMTGALSLPANGLNVGSTQLTMVGGNVGIGEASPAFPLNFASTLGDKISLYGTSSPHFGLGIQMNQLQIFVSNSTDDIVFGYGSSASLSPTVVFKGTGAVGIGTATPSATLHVSQPLPSSTEGSLALLDSNNTGAGSGGSLDFKDLGSGYLASIVAVDNGASDGRLEFRTSGDSTLTATRLSPPSTRMAILPNGKVGIGTVAPASTLHVVGSLCVTTSGTCAGSTPGMIYASTTTVAAGDLAENMHVEDESLRPGDVVALEQSSIHHEAVFARSTLKNQINAIGVISTRPGVALGSETKSSRPIALAGRVPVNVTLEGGAIRTGDFLVASSIPGKAMRAKGSTDAGIIGIALSNYDGQAIAVKNYADGVAHESGDQVMMLVQNNSGNGSALQDLAERTAHVEAENRELKAFLCSKFPDTPNCDVGKSH